MNQKTAAFMGIMRKATSKAKKVRTNVMPSFEGGDLGVLQKRYAKMLQGKGLPKKKALQKATDIDDMSRLKALTGSAGGAKVLAMPRFSGSQGGVVEPMKKAAGAIMEEGIFATAFEKVAYTRSTGSHAREYLVKTWKKFRNSPLASDARKAKKKIKDQKGIEKVLDSPKGTAGYKVKKKQVKGVRKFMDALSQ